MIRDLTKRVPLFWLLQTGGWGVYLLALSLATLPYIHLKDFLYYRIAFGVTCFASSFLLRVVCRALWKARTGWIQASIGVVGCSFGFGFLGNIVAVIAENRLGAIPPRPFVWSSTLSGTLNAGFVLFAWGALYFGVKYYQALSIERERALVAEASAREAELRALRYQIHPHFLFNTLNAISTLVVEGNGQAATRMIARLADFFRATLDGKHQNEVSLQNEIFLIDQYLEIEKIRLGDRLKVEIEVAPELSSVLVPHLLLQPLVENAIRHGIAPKRDGGLLIIRAERVERRIRITVADNGRGKPANQSTASATANGIGLANTEKRLKQLYGIDSRFELSWPQSGGCKVVIEIPLSFEQEHLIREAVV